jgi:xylulokinase
MKNYLLGIDIGTSSCKVSISTISGEIAGQAQGDYGIFHPKPGWVEQDPNEWWRVLCDTIKKTLHKNNIDPGDIAGIGVDGQSWSAIPIDRKGNVLCNTPIWMDTRAHEICGQIKQEIDEDEIFRLCGNPFQPSYTTPKILWYRKYLPDVYKKTYKILQSNGFIVYKLTDQITMDTSQGYGLHCFDIRKCAIDPGMCGLLGIDQEMIPQVYPSHQIVGTVSTKAAAETGLREGTPVAAGGLDAACGTLGAGVMHAGEAQEQGGQAGGMSICMEEIGMDKRLILGAHVVPGKWLLQGGTVGGGGILKWFEREFCEYERNAAREQGLSSMQIMDGEASKIHPGSDGVVFLPYMSGERSPIWNSNAKGVYYGLDYSKTRAHMIRASMEGAAFSLRHNLDAAKEAGADVRVLHSVGGAAKSALWTQMKADIVQKEIAVASSDAATSLGAIMLAGVGAGVYRDFEEAVSVNVHMKKRYVPSDETYSVYRKNYDLYIELYQKLEETMNKQGETK